jgi:choline dehydrogenase-like flavoprotein
MITDLLALEDGTALETDVCVIGSGPAGLALVAELIDGPHDVVLLESGGFEPDPAIEELSMGTSVGHQYGGLVNRPRGFGGSSQVWPGQVMQLTPIDFEARHWVEHSGWPIERDELDVYYHRAMRFLALPLDALEGDIWRLSPAEEPSFRRSELVTTHSVFAPRPRLGSLLQGKFANAARLRTFLHATATRLCANESGSHVERVEVATLGGTRVSVKARTFVIACGTIENARLLLASGLGNDLVGRFLQDHVVAICAAVTSASEDRLQEMFTFFDHGRVRHYPKIALSPDLQRREHLLNCGANLVFHTVEDSVEESALRVRRALRTSRRPALADLMSVGRRPVHAARLGWRQVRGRPFLPPIESVHLLAMCEQAPNPLSRVRLSTTEKDALGVPRPEIDWHLEGAERRTIATLASTVAAELRRTGLGDAQPAAWLDGEDWANRVYDTVHQMGTTRMAESAAEGVVDPDCRVHGLDNLYAAGASVFPTGGYSNPTLTLIALALRLADRLRGASSR